MVLCYVLHVFSHILIYLTNKCMSDQVISFPLLGVHASHWGWGMVQHFPCTFTYFENKCLCLRYLCVYVGFMCISYKENCIKQS